MTKIFLVEDETLVRAGMRELIGMAPDCELAGDAENGEAAVAALKQVQADVILMDVRMPKMNGPATIVALREAGCEIPVILFTTFDDEEALVEGMKAGAKGYVRKDISLEQLREVIFKVLAGETVFRPMITQQGLGRLEALRPQFESSVLPEDLTPRETEVLRLVASGFSNREIAELLGNSEATIKTHASTILAKLGVRDRTRAVLKALEMGIL